MDVDELNGISTYLDASGGWLGYTGVDMVSNASTADLNGKTIDVQVSGKFRAGIDFHITQVQTQTLSRTS